MNDLIRKALYEAIDELELFHGTPYEFDKFSLVYLSSGFGAQAHGYGVYLTTSKNAAKEYSQGGLIYTVEIPDGKYLDADGISGKELKRIANKIYRYILDNDEEGIYNGVENELWEHEVKYLLDSEDGEQAYGTVSSFLGNDKETSEFFYNLGYKGLIVYDTNVRTNEIFKNYVIFNEEDITIVSKERL